MEWKKRWLTEKELRESLGSAFQAYGKPLGNVAAFKYLGRVMTAGYDDWMEVVGKLQKVRKTWGRMSSILIQEGAYPKVLGHFFKAVVQAVFLWGAETWLLTPRVERDLCKFQHKFA